MVAEEGFGLLDAPVAQVTGLDTPVPLAAVAEEYVLPTEADVRSAILGGLDLAGSTEVS